MESRDFMESRQSIKELAEKLEGMIGNILGSGSYRAYIEGRGGTGELDALRSPLVEIQKTAGDFMETIENTVRQIKQESVREPGEDDLVFKVSFLGTETDRYYLVDNVVHIDLARLLFDYTVQEMGEFHPENYLTEHGVHLYLWKDSEDPEKNSPMPDFYDVLYTDDGNIVDAHSMSAVLQAEMGMNRAEYGGAVFDGEQRKLVTDYAYKFDNPHDTQILIKELAEAMEEPDVRAVREVMDNARVEINALPDPGISLTEMHLSGIHSRNVFPLKKERALELHREGLAIYGLHRGWDKTLMGAEQDILTHDGIFGVEELEWENYRTMENTHRETAAEKNIGNMEGTETGEKTEEPAAKEYQEVEIFGIPALFDNARIQPEDVPDGLYLYDLRGSDYDPGDPVTVEAHVGVNHAASILTTVPLPVPERGYLRIGEELNFVGGMASVREFMDRNHGLDMDSLMEDMENAICHENEDVFLAPSAGADRYAIYQLNEKAEGDSYLFMGMEAVKRLGMEVKGGDYSLVYGGRLAEHENPDTLFEKFNIAHPKGFTGHSLSVSDVVVINRGGNVDAYYVDSFGFTRLPEFVKERQEMPAPEMEERMEGLMVKGHFGTWHSVDSVEIKGEKFFLMESDDYGEILNNFAVNEEGEVVAEDLENGFDEGFYEALEEYFEGKGIADGKEAVEYPSVYPHTIRYAAEHGEKEAYRESHNLNIACKTAIEAAIRKNFDGMHLNEDAVKPVLEEYGAERVGYVLASTIRQKEEDGRFSRSNKEWAAETLITEGADMGEYRKIDFVVESHPAVLDGFVDLFQEELKELEKDVQDETQDTVEHDVQKADGQKQTEPETVTEPEQKMQKVDGEPTAAEPELEDEWIDLGDEREEVLAQMRGILGDSGGCSDGKQPESDKIPETEKTSSPENEQAEPQETELAFQMADQFIAIHETDGGYDYSIMGADYKGIEGGVYDNPDVSIREALADVVEDLRYETNPVVRGEVAENSELIPIDYDGLMDKNEQAEKEGIEAAEWNKSISKSESGIVADFKARTDGLFHEISDMNPSEIEETVKCHVQAKIDETGIDAVIVDAVLVGSRCRGLEKQDSDIDVVVELETDEREDSMFDSFNEDGLSIGGIKVDINPITAQRTGTLETYLPQAEEYLDGVRQAREKEAEERIQRGQTGQEEVSLIVAECGEFHNRGEFYGNIPTVDEALAIWGQIPQSRMNGIPSIGISIHRPGDDTYQDMEADLIFGGRMDLSVLEQIHGIRNSPQAMEMVAELIAKAVPLMPGMEIDGQMDRELEARVWEIRLPGLTPAEQIAVEIDRLSYDYDTILYNDSVSSMTENVTDIADSIRQGDTGYLTAWLADVINESTVQEEMRRAVDLLQKMADYRPLVKVEELEEQNYNAIDGVLNNGAGEKALKEEKQRKEQKSVQRVSLKERLAQKKAFVDNKGIDGQEKTKDRDRELKM